MFKVASLQLPTPNGSREQAVFRQLGSWSNGVTSALNSFGPTPSGSSASASPFVMLTFQGANAAVAISQHAHLIEGGTSLQTITAPQGWIGDLVLIPTTVFAIVSGGNIQVPGGSLTTIPYSALVCAYDGANWYVCGSQLGDYARLGPYTVPADGLPDNQWNLGVTPASATENLFRNGSHQAPGAGYDYTIDGMVVTFNAGSAPQVGDVLTGWCFAQ